MSREHPNILYVGDMEQGRALAAAAEARDWYVHTPGETMEALAMYTTFFPDIVIIDTLPRVTFAHEVYYHLRSVNAQPIMVLADDRQPGWWGDFDIHLLSRSISREALLDTVGDVLVTEPMVRDI
jgi:hypothetical protein